MFDSQRLIDCSPMAIHSLTYFLFTATRTNFQTSMHDSKHGAVSLETIRATGKTMNCAFFTDEGSPLRDGTVSRTSLIPGYMGHVPSARNEIEINRYISGERRVDTTNKTCLSNTFNVRGSGYQGHLPGSVSNRLKILRTSALGTRTTYGSDFR